VTYAVDLTPAARADIVDVLEWSLVNFGGAVRDGYEALISVNLSANEDVAAANMFNEPPADGYQYAIANVTVTYKGADSSYPAFVNIDHVTSSGEVISTWDSLAVPPEPTFGGGELYAGGSATGNLAFAIPSSADGVLRITPGVFADDVFVATR